MNNIYSDNDSEVNQRFGDYIVAALSRNLEFPITEDVAKILSTIICSNVSKVMATAIKLKRHEKGSNKLHVRHINSSLTLLGLGYLNMVNTEINDSKNIDIDLNNISGLFQGYCKKRTSVPCDIKLSRHWLALEGIQPLVAENPPPLPDELSFLLRASLKPTKEEKFADTVITKFKRLRNVPNVQVKPYAQSLMSVEEEQYYDMITKACVGSNELARENALNSLQSTPILYILLPRFCCFIAEGVRVNVALCNFSVLVYLMRMLKALLSNGTINLKMYLHELVPATLTCCLTKALCTATIFDKHWVLRDFAAFIIAEMCRKFNNCINMLQTRVFKVYTIQLADGVPFTILYGAIVGLAALGRDVICSAIIPYLSNISDRIEPFLQQPSEESASATTAAHIRSLIRRHCPIVLSELRVEPDIESEYIKEYGYLGKFLYNDVVELRQLLKNAEFPASIFKPASAPKPQLDKPLDPFADYIINVPRFSQNSTEACSDANDEFTICRNVALNDDFYVENKPYVPSIADIKKSLLNPSQFETLQLLKDQAVCPSEVIATKNNKKVSANVNEHATPQELPSTSIMSAKPLKSNVTRLHRNAGSANALKLHANLKQKLCQPQKAQSKVDNNVDVNQIISDNLAALNLSLSENSSSSSSEKESSSSSDSESSSDSDNETAAQPAIKRHISTNEPQKRVKLDIASANHESNETSNLPDIESVGSHAEFEASAKAISANVELQQKELVVREEEALPIMGTELEVCATSISTAVEFKQMEPLVREEALPILGTELILKEQNEKYSPTNFQPIKRNEFNFSKPQNKVILGLLERTDVNWPKYRLGGLTPPPRLTLPLPQLSIHQRNWTTYNQAITNNHSTHRKPNE